jgi:hypothetical protein
MTYLRTYTIFSEKGLTVSRPSYIQYERKQHIQAEHDATCTINHEAVLIPCGFCECSSEVLSANVLAKCFVRVFQ